MFGGLQENEGATWDWRNAERIADMPVDMVSTSQISLPIIFSNLVKKSMTDSEVVVLTVLVLGVRTGGCSPSESSDRVIRDRDRVRIGL